MLPLLFLAVVANGWLTNPDDGRNSGKMLLIDFRADWCAPCKVMDAQVYTPEFIASAARRFVLVRIDYDKQRAIARRYEVEEMPTIVFADSWGGEMLRHTGTLSAASMAAVIQALPPDISAFNHLEEILARDKNNLVALVEMADKLQAAGLFIASNTYYQRALHHHPANRQAILKGIAKNDEALRL